MTPVEHPEQAVQESWFIDWAINKTDTITGYEFTYSQAGEGYSYLKLSSNNLNNELQITDNQVNALRGDGLPFPPAGGDIELVDTSVVYGVVPSGSVPVLWIDSSQDGDGNFTWANEERVAYQIIDVVNSTTFNSTTGYDTLVLGQRVYPLANGTAFEDDFVQFESAYVAGLASAGQSPNYNSFRHHHYFCI
jgi:hypothetical protein